MTELFFVIGLLVALTTGCGSSGSNTDSGPSDTGRVFRIAGDYKLKGDYVRGILVAPGTNGAERLTIKTKTGVASQQVDLQPGWFVFVEAENRLWAYYGANDLVLMTFSEKEDKICSVFSAPELIDDMPKAVHDMLPEAFKNKLPPSKVPDDTARKIADPQK